MGYPPHPPGFRAHSFETPRAVIPTTAESFGGNRGGLTFTMRQMVCDRIAAGRCYRPLRILLRPGRSSVQYPRLNFAFFAPEAFEAY